MKMTHGGRGFRSGWAGVGSALLGMNLMAAAGVGAGVPPGRITAFQRDGAGVVRLEIADPFQGSATVERSPDLRAWEPLATVSLVDRTAVFTDAAAPPRMAFYRLAPPLLDYRGAPTVSFGNVCFTVREASTTVNLPVFRSGPLDSPLEVPWLLVPDGATPGLDYEPDSGVVQFASGASQTVIPLRLKADTVAEPDEAVIVVLMPAGATAMPDPAACVVIADDDTALTTVVAGAGLQSSYWISNAGPPTLLIHQGRLVWNGPAEGRVFSFAAGELAPRTEAASFGIPAQMTTAGPWLVRLEMADGIAAGGCTGTRTMGKLVRSALDGSAQLVLARPSLCGVAVPPVMNAEAVFYVETQVSPDLYHLRRIPINGGEPQTLLSLTWPPRSLLVAGPWLWCVEASFPDPENRNSVLWRVAIDGSGADEWLTGFRAPVGQLVRDEEFLYLADTSYGGVERIHRISPVERMAQVVWETSDLSRERAIQSIALAAGQLVWLDQNSLRTMATSGGTVRTLVDGIEFPDSVAVGPQGIAWSQGAPSGQIRLYDPRTGDVTTWVESVREPGPLMFAGETLLFTAGTGYDEGAGQILALPAGSSEPVPVAGGMAVQQPPLATGGAAIFASDLWNFKRLDGAGQIPAIIYQGTMPNTGFTADATAFYWASEPQGSILAANHDGTQLRLLAAAGGRPIALQTDPTHLFWIDEPSRLRSVPIVGGAVTDVLTGFGAISSFLLDGDTVYAALQDAGLLVRVAKTGGPVTTLTGIPVFQHTLLAQTAGAVLWTAGNSIQAISKAGGSPAPVAQGLAEEPSAMATDGASVYWLEPIADRIRAVALPE